MLGIRFLFIFRLVIELRRSMFVSLELGLSSFLTSLGLPLETRLLGFPWLSGPDFYLLGEGLTLLFLIFLDLPFFFSSFSIETSVTSFSSLLLLFWGFSPTFVCLGDCLLFSYLGGDGTLSLMGDTFLLYFFSSTLTGFSFFSSTLTDFSFFSSTLTGYSYTLTDFYFFTSSFWGCGLPGPSPSFLPFSFLLFLTGSLGLFFLSSLLWSFYLDSKDLFFLLYFFFSGFTSFNLLS